jgi:hypothetical protein
MNEAPETFLANEDLARLQNLKDIAIRNKKTKGRYQYVDTEEMCNSVCTYLNEIGYETTPTILTGASKTSSKHILEITLDNMELFGGESNSKGDGMRGKILIINSFNGEAALTVLAGAIRFACANGIISGEKEFFEKVKHREGQRLEGALMMLNETVYTACEWLKNSFAARIDLMKSMALRFDKEAKIVFDLNLPDNITAEVLKRRHPANIKKLRAADRSRNIWTLYNVINEVIREKSRHAMNDFEHNQSLLNDVIEFAKAA